MKLKYFKIFLFFLCISCGYTNKEGYSVNVPKK